MKKCKICNNEIIGRSDKLFCSVKCKNYYHVNLRRNTDKVAKNIDNILHRNRSILLEIIGKNKNRITLDKIILDKKKFDYNYHTHCITNSKGKLYHYVYDFAWMSFSDDKILIVKKRQSSSG